MHILTVIISIQMIQYIPGYTLYLLLTSIFVHLYCFLTKFFSQVSLLNSSFISDTPFLLEGRYKELIFQKYSSLIAPNLEISSGTEVLFLGVLYLNYLIFVILFTFPNRKPWLNKDRYGD